MIKSNNCKKILKKIQLNVHFFKKLPKSEKRLTTASLITIARIILIPPLLYAMVLQLWGIATLLFIVAALTDMCDGMYARFFNEKTVLGACLDPLADKCLVLSCFATLACIPAPFVIVPHVFVMGLLCKELLQMGGSLLVWAIHGHIEVHPTILGKITTCVQMIFLLWLFLCYYFHLAPEQHCYYAFIIFMGILIMTTFFQYVYMGIGYIRYSLTDIN